MSTSAHQLAWTSGRTRVSLVVGLLATTSVLLGVPQLAGAAAADRAVPAPTPSYQVTIVARTCDSFASIMANRARNNIQESLQDLGPDTLYSSGQPVSPRVEDVNATTQVAGCDPLAGWRFQLGTGIAGKSDFLSQVSNPYAPPPGPTTASVPELDPQGQPTGRTVQGARTITLTSAQAQLAQQSSRLWIQGGVVGDPLLDNPPSPFDPPQAFGALRCAVDNLNGDNVEWIGFPSGATHVFCYYFAVSPPPEAATIRVVKQLPGSEAPVNRTFGFAGNVSYVPGPTGDPNDNPFGVPVNGRTGSVDFVRAADTSAPWTLYEQEDPDWALTNADCRSRDGTSTITPPGTVQQGPAGRFAVTLGAGDLVTCTFTNVRDIAGLAIEKVTEEGTGTFDFRASSPSGLNTASASVTTLQPGDPVRALEITGASGTFTAQEDLPSGVAAGAWTISRVSCNGTDLSPTPVVGQPASGTIAPGANVLCTVYNSPQGSITVRKTSEGGTGTFSFVIVPLGGFPLDGTGGNVGLSATTNQQGVRVPATPTDGSNTGLPFQRYAVVELAPPSEPSGTWRLTEATCDASDSTSVRSAGLIGAAFTLSPADPTVTCDFTDELVPAAALQVVKTVSGDASARTGEVLVSVQCNDATTASLVGPAGRPGPFSLPQRLVFTDFLWNAQDEPTLSCRVREAETGVADGATVATEWTVVTDGVPAPPTSGESVRVDPTPGQVVTVRVENTYQSASGPTPTPTPSGTDGGGTGGAAGGGAGGPLPVTGLSGALALTLGAGLVLLVLGGIALIVSYGRGRRTAERPQSS